MAGLIDFSQPTLYISAASIVFNPTFWNIAARSEYHNKTITRIFNNNPRYGCYALALTIFSLGLLRDYIYAMALSNQPSHPVLTSPITPTSLGLAPNLSNAFPAIPPQYLAYALLAAGNTLVLSSMYALGVTGTYLGDYFGILMDEPVTSFPFNVVGAPMYVGSALSFAGTAVHWGKPAGLGLTGFVAVCYYVACQWEDPFTGMIYEKREKERREGKKGK